MRIIFLMVILTGLLIPSNKLNAQYRGFGEPGISYINRNIFGTGLSLGGFRHGYAGSRSVGFLPVTAYLEFGLLENLTAGPFLGYGRWIYRNTSFASPHNYTWSHTAFGGRGSWHISGALVDLFGADINESRVDWYISLLLGFDYRRYSADAQEYSDFYPNSIHFIIGPMVGVRYYLGNYIAFNLEAGRGSLGYVTAGISVSL